MRRLILVVAILLIYTTSDIYTFAQTPTAPDAKPNNAAPTVNKKLEAVRNNPPPRGTRIIIRGRNGVEIPARFIKLNDTTLELVDLFGKKTIVPLTLISSFVIADTTRLTADDRKRLAELKTERGNVRDLAGQKRVYILSSDTDETKAIAEEFAKHQDLEIVTQFQQADFIAYFYADSSIGVGISSLGSSIPFRFVAKLTVFNYVNDNFPRIVWSDSIAVEVEARSGKGNSTEYHPCYVCAASDLANKFAREYKRKALEAR